MSRTASLIALSLALAAGPAAAQAPGGAAASPAPVDPAQQAAAFFEEGRELFRAKQFREAAEKFQAAYNLDPVPILLYNLARASEEMGDPEQAITHYKTYLARIPQNAEDRGEVETRVRVMEKTVQAARLARITIQGVPVGAKVLIDEQPAEDPIDGAYRVEPGAHRVQVVTPDHVWAHEVTLAAGQPVTLTYEAAPAPPPPPPPPSGPSTQALVGYITGGVGAASLIIGGVFWGQAQSAVDDYDAAKAAILRGGDRAALDALAVKKQNAQDDAESSATAAYVFWGIGGAALAAGSALVVLDLLGMPVLDMAVVPTAGGIGVAGTF